jgi:hypothetical protein
MNQRALDTCAKHHEWGLELMTGVRGEPVQAAEALLQPGEHAVDRQRQSRHLVTRQRHRQPSMKAPAVGDRLDLVHDGLHRP